MMERENRIREARTAIEDGVLKQKKQYEDGRWGSEEEARVLRCKQEKEGGEIRDRLAAMNTELVEEAKKQEAMSTKKIDDLTVNLDPSKVDRKEPWIRYQTKYPNCLGEIRWVCRWIKREGEGYYETVAEVHETDALGKDRWIEKKNPGTWPDAIIEELISEIEDIKKYLPDLDEMGELRAIRERKKKST